MEGADRTLESREDQIFVRPERTARPLGWNRAELILSGTVGIGCSYLRASGRGIRTNTYARSRT